MDLEMSPHALVDNEAKRQLHGTYASANLRLPLPGGYREDPPLRPTERDSRDSLGNIRVIESDATLVWGNQESLFC